MVNLQLGLLLVQHGITVFTIHPRKAGTRGLERRKENGGQRWKRSWLGNKTELYQPITHRGQAVLGKAHGLTSARAGLGKPDFCLVLAGPGQHRVGGKEVHISVFHG